MHTVKRSFALLLLMTLCVMNTVTATDFSTDENSMIQPRYIGASGVTADINVLAPGRVNVTGNAIVYREYTATVTLSLERNGTTIKSWSESGSGTFNLSKNYYVMSGYDYSASIKVDVYDSNNKLIETITAESIVVAS